MTDLEAAELANGKLLTELEQLRARYNTIQGQRQALERDYYAARNEATRLSGTTADRRLADLQRKTDAEQARYDRLIEQVKAARGTLTRLQILTERFVAAATVITDEI